jgi:RNA polymerase sigma-70 factor (ECF subfamily)
MAWIWPTTDRRVVDGRFRERATSNARVDSVGGGISPELLDACRRGDREAWRALYEAHKDKVYSIAFYFLKGDPAAAADVTQQVFLKLMDGIGKYHGSSSFSTWLHRVVVNACIDSTRRGRRLPVAMEPAVLQAVPDSSTSHEDQFARLEVAQSVQDAIAQLPSKLRIAILLRYFDDLAYTDMAAALDCSIGTVSSRLSRAHRLLAQRLAPLRAVGPTHGPREE